MLKNLPLVELKYLLKNSCSAETAYNPDLWTPENTFFGHCAVVALVVQEFNGGKIKNCRFTKEWAKILGSRLHYWNEFPDGKAADLTRSQFPADFPYDDLIGGKINRILVKSRNDLLSFPDTNRRYGILSKKVNCLSASNPLFADEKFQRAWELAFSGEAVCPKMKFACSVYDKTGNLIAESTNKNFTEKFGRKRLCALDGSNCERMGMLSRTDATLGDCGHAPIWCLSKVFELGWKPSDLPMLDFYEGGFKPDGSPWWRTEPSYTCTYCENMFAIFGLDKIYGAFDGAWHPLWTKDSLYSSVKYAKGERRA